MILDSNLLSSGSAVSPYDNVQKYHGAIAVIGMGFRFPGDLKDESALWNTLANGRHCITRVPADRWPVDELQHADRSEPGCSVTFAAGVLSELEAFDAAFFGISPREAAWMDPQHRLLLEMAHESMEDAGVRPSSLAGTSCGVYMGLSSLDYGQHALEDLASMTAHTMTGNTLSLAANRLSYVFDLRGPSMAVDTACSSSLVALHHACAALRNGEMPLALAGGVSMLLHPYAFVGFSKAFMLSATGRCRPFDAAADGYVRAEGGAVLLLKPLSRALADHDRVHAVILASGVNADGGRKTGLTIPSAEAQAELMRDVLGRSGLCAEDVDFIEAHGTGTQVGDPVEITAISEVYGQCQDRMMPITSVKANLGHLESASGMAGFVKAVLCLKKGQLPPLPGVYTPNPQIDFARLNVRCAASGAVLEQKKSRQFTAGINSFGFGGVNAHVLMQAMEPPAITACQEAHTLVPPLFLSARSDESLRELASAYAARIETSPASAYYDVAYSAVWHRDRYDRRLAVTAESPASIASTLRAFAENEGPVGAQVEQVSPGRPDLVFVYTGNGAQWIGMGRTLLAESPQFTEIMHKLDADMKPLMGFSLYEALLSDEPENLRDTTVSQPLLFALQVAFTLQLRSLGITPQAVMGHSVGEIAAAWAAGALSLQQAIQVIYARSHAQGQTRGAGRMAAVGLSATVAQAHLETLGLTRDIEIAGVNSPHNVTLSGSLSGLERLESHLQTQNVFFRLLDLEYAFHSREMDGIRELVLQPLAGLCPAPAEAAIFASTVTGATLEGQALDSSYWWNNVRQPVQFSAAVATLAKQGFRNFVEITPQPILQRYLRESLGELGIRGRILSSLHRNDDGCGRIVRLASQLHLLTDKGDLRALFPHVGNRVALPLYPWRKERHWFPRTSECLPEKRREHPLLGWRCEGEGLNWEQLLHPTMQPWLGDHKVGGAVVFPAAGYAEMALAAAQCWLGGQHVALESLDISVPLVFDERQAQCVRSHLCTADGTFRLFSRPRLSTGEWVQHAAGRIVSVDASVPAPVLPAVPGACSRLEGAALYAQTASVQLDYGPAFQLVRELCISGNLLEARLRPVDVVAEGFLLHPVVLDACFHSLVSLYPDRGHLPVTAFLPIGTGRLERCREGEVSRIRAQIRQQGRRSLMADFELFDEEGRLLARAAGCRFRAAPMSSGASVSTWSLRPWLSPHPHEEVRATVPTLEEVAGHLATVDTGLHVDRKTWFTRDLPLMEALVLSYALEAFHTLAKEDPHWQQRLTDPYSLWLAQILRLEGLLQERDGIWSLSPVEELPSSDELWQEIVRHSPQCVPALLPMGRVGIRLHDVLLGRLNGATLLDEVRNSQVYRALQQTSPAISGIGEALDTVLHYLVETCPAHRVLRVLEVAAAPAGVTELLEASLAEDRVLHVLALPDGEAAGQARTRYAKHPSVRVTTIDDGHWNFDDMAIEGSFDVIILRHVLHRTSHLAEALMQVRGKLAAGGLVLVAERHPDWSADILEGLDSAWWHTRCDSPDSPQSSLLSPETWQHVFAEQGFDHPAVYTEPAAGSLREGAYLLLASCADDELQLSELVEQPTATWLVLADEASEALATQTCERLKNRGQCATCLMATAGPIETSLANADHMVFMRGWADEPQLVAPTLEALRQVAQACAGRDSTASALWVVTCGGALGTQTPEACLSRPSQCAVWGLGRVIANECGELSCVMIDVPAQQNAPELAKRLELELLQPDGTDELLLTPESRYALKVREGYEAVSHAQAERCQLDFTAPGRLQNLAWSAQEARPLLHGEIEARVMATGLNFRDVMLTMGLLPDDAVENGFAGPNLGLEFAGVVTRVGEGVENLTVGDRVAGFAPSCFASHVTTPAHTVVCMPESWSHEAAASIPTAFITAYYALKTLAQMQPGERLLIHGAAGGVGLAAIQVARHLGVEIIATAGSDEKRDFIRLLGVKQVFDSRSLSFANDVLAATGGQGVDVVLNSLAGEAMRRSLGILRPFGRFLELGKRDFVENTTLGLRPMKENISYFAIDVDQLIVARPRLAANVFGEVMELLREDVLTPLPYRAFRPQQVVEAFRTMQQSRHLGKIVVNLTELPPLAAGASSGLLSRQEQRFCSASTWLVTGGMSGFGLATARHLAKRGVTHLVLAGRRGAQTAEAADTLEAFAAMGVQVRAEACDMTDAVAVRTLIENIRSTMPPLKGVVHAAAVFDDRFLAQLDTASFEAVLGPKLSGAWNLHQATRDVPLEHFVLYSSISTALGNPGQGNYVAANAGLEGLAQWRAERGLPATCIAWGPVGDVGYLARHGAVKKSLELRLGKAPLSSEEALNALDEALAGGGVRILANVDWSVVAGVGSGRALSRLALVSRHAASHGRSETALNMHQWLAEHSPEEAMELVRGLIIEEVAQVLALGTDQVASDRTLQSMGLDSLMAVELAMSLEQRLGVRLPAMVLQDAPTVEQIARRLLSRLSSPAQDDGVAAAAELARRHAVDFTAADLDAMTQSTTMKGERA